MAVFHIEHYICCEFMVCQWLCVFDIKDLESLLDYLVDGAKLEGVPLPVVDGLIPKGVKVPHRIRH